MIIGCRAKKERKKGRKNGEREEGTNIQSISHVPVGEDRWSGERRTWIQSLLPVRALMNAKTPALTA